MNLQLRLKTYMAILTILKLWQQPMRNGKTDMHLINIELNVLLMSRLHKLACHRNLIEFPVQLRNRLISVE